VEGVWRGGGGGCWLCFDGGGSVRSGGWREGLWGQWCFF